jgi:hypothetical protein
MVSQKLPGLIADVVGDDHVAKRSIKPRPKNDVFVAGPDVRVQVNSRTYSVHGMLEHMATSAGSSMEVLERMTRHPQPHIRASVAENKKAPYQLIIRLAQDEDPTVRYQLAENPHLPMDVLKQLSEDDNPYVACRAQKTIDRVSQVV